MRKIPQPHPIHRSGKFLERHSFHIVLGNRPKLCGNSTLPQNFHTRKLGEIMISYAIVWSCQTLPDFFNFSKFSVIGISLRIFL